MNGGAIVQPPDDIFRYRVPEVKSEEGAERASMVVARLGVLSSLWNWMIESGENLPGSTEPLLRYNIWKGPLKGNRIQASSFQAAARARKKPDIQLFLKLLASTFERTHGAAAFQAAEAMLYSRPAPAPRSDVAPTFKDLRDRAVLLLMVHTGVRAKEVGSLKRRDIRPGDPPTLTIVGKGNKKRVIGVPRGSMVALAELTAKMRSMAEHQERWNYSTRAGRLLEPDAPLLPALSYWGANRGTPDKGLSRPGFALLLNRRAEAAGIERGTPEFARVHPHGLRALFVTHALETGTPIHRVQAIAGHAQIATTGRYAEERRPEHLIVDAFRGQSPMQAAEPRAPIAAPQPSPQVQQLTADSWDSEEEEIRAPAPPRPKTPEQIRPPVESIGQLSEEQEQQTLEELRQQQERFEVKPVLQVRQRPEQIPDIRPPTAGQMRSQVDKLAAKMAKWRSKPLTEREQKLLSKCAGIGEESMRNLCVIYSVHWGEKGNRQVLVSTGGGKASAAARRGEEDSPLGVFYSPNQGLEEFDEEDEEEEEDFSEEDLESYFDEETDEEELAAFQAGAQEDFVQVMREGSAQLFAESGTDRLNRIYSGKDSGLSWWTGTQGVLEPAMPVMSAAQVGNCTPEEESSVCAGLLKLWQEWFAESPTKAEALVQWIGEALDVAAQMEGEVARRDGSWVPADAPWPETRFQGTRRQPDPRTIFREHVDQEVVAWFKARAGSYRTSPGNPEGWRKKSEQPKVVGATAPSWYQDDDPIRSLPIEERRALLDWILALTGQMPVDTDRRFKTPDGSAASRAAVARFVNAMCQLDKTIAALRDEAKRQKSEGRKGAYFSLSPETVDKVPAQFRVYLQRGNEEVRAAMSEATGSRVIDFDGYQAIRARVRGKRAGDEKRQMLHRYYLGLVSKHFGPEAAKDPAIALVAKCGDVPLNGFKQLFRVRGETIMHEESFMRAFAREFGSHSECVARRIARQLWEIKQGRDTPKEAVTKPQHMVTLVEVMRLFKVPCSKAQAAELRGLRRWTDEPDAIYAEFAKVKMRSGAAKDALTEAEEQEAALADKFESSIKAAFVADVMGEYNENPRRLALPSPVQLSFALM